jgi:cystathionine beta-lyase
MSYNFDRVVDRTTGSSEKWSFEGLPLAAGRAPIPLWIADMDFPTAPPIVDALQRAVQDGVFGYARVTDGFRQSVLDWHLTRHGWAIEPDWLVQTAGVVAALTQIVTAFTREGDTVLIQPPVYARFGKLCRINHRRVAVAPLCEQDRCYAFDVEAFELVIRQERPKIFILCNPHNPVGKVWRLDELRAMGEICLRHGVMVVADEIHADLIVRPGCAHIPFASIDPSFAQHSITCTSPSKSFNLAGLQVSNVIVPNTTLREALLRAMEGNGCLGVNSLGLVACEAAYRHGAPWLEALLDYLRGNHRYRGGVHARVAGVPGGCALSGLGGLPQAGPGRCRVRAFHVAGRRRLDGPWPELRPRG